MTPMMVLIPVIVLVLGGTILMVALSRNPTPIADAHAIRASELMSMRLRILENLVELPVPTEPFAKGIHEILVDVYNTYGHQRTIATDKDVAELLRTIEYGGKIDTVSPATELGHQVKQRLRAYLSR